MCLVLAFSNTKKINLSRCLNSIGNTLLKTEDDGFGYAIQGKDGVFGEKTTSKKFRTRLSKPNQIILPIVKKQYMSFGKPTELTGPGIFHGRTSTNYISLLNTHPMQADGWHLIHNGVVEDLGPHYAKLTQNDSEDVLKRLMDGIGKPNPMEDIEKYLEGYYAFAAIDPQGQLHIARDKNATLYMGYSDKYETYIFGTTESLIIKVSKILDAKIGPIDELQEDLYCIFSGNELIHCQDFKSMGYTNMQARYAQQSLGRDLGGAGVKDVTGGVYDATKRINNVTEEEWQGGIEEFLTHEGSKHPDRSWRDAEEESYYKWRNEIDNMDASYQIYALDDRSLTVDEFKQMDFIQQELCTIIRSDGTVVDPEDYETLRLRGARGRHA